ncbi:hypothetical protein ABPG74_009800 [Tetrahymena malaccensis]
MGIVHQNIQLDQILIEETNQSINQSVSLRDIQTRHSIYNINIIKQSTKICQQFLKMGSDTNKVKWKKKKGNQTIKLSKTKNNCLFDFSIKCLKKSKKKKINQVINLYVQMND